MRMVATAPKHVVRPAHRQMLKGVGGLLRWKPQQRRVGQGKHPEQVPCEGKGAIWVVGPLQLKA